ncbi:MAG: hypothetical protein LBJ03_03510 [Holosporales bacterium]|jgi:hypothetical protein|nr:hypothetical protein [Holosporales bacterium]
MNKKMLLSATALALVLPMLDSDVNAARGEASHSNIPEHLHSNIKKIHGKLSSRGKVEHSRFLNALSAGDFPKAHNAIADSPELQKHYVPKEQESGHASRGKSHMGREHDHGERHMGRRQGGSRRR